MSANFRCLVTGVYEPDGRGLEGDENDEVYGTNVPNQKNDLIY